MGLTQRRSDHTASTGLLTCRRISIFLTLRIWVPSDTCYLSLLGLDRVISIFQQKYAYDLVQYIAMLTCRPASTCIDPNLNLIENSEKIPSEPLVYQQIIGRLAYLTPMWPDLLMMFVSRVSLCTPWTSHLDEYHIVWYLDAVYHIVRDLKSCHGFGLFYVTGHK